MERIDRFYKIITGQLALSALPVDLEESELLAVLEELECFDLHTFEKASSNVQRMRAHIRYLAALARVKHAGSYQPNPHIDQQQPHRLLGHHDHPPW